MLCYMHTFILQLTRLGFLVLFIVGSALIFPVVVIK